jgi:hypothetical protein
MGDGRTLIVGGTAPDGAATSVVASFDTATNQFTVAGTLLSARTGHTATLLKDGRVLVAGGTTDSLVSTDIEIFDPSTGASTLVAQMPEPRRGHVAALLQNGSVVIAGGYTTENVVLQSAFVFDPATNSIAPTPSGMNVARASASATTLIDGRVVIIGGTDGTNDLRSAEIFDPSLQSFTTTSTQLSVPVHGHSAVLLPHNGSVLVAGGTSNGVAQAGADLFLPAIFPDPFSWGVGQFAQAAAMNAARSSAIGGATAAEGYSVVTGSGSNSVERYRFATIKTDKDDYPPGQRALITGSGWEPNEEVTLLFQEDPAVHEDYVLTVRADGDGNISHDQWAPEAHDANVRFYLMATGQQSGRRAQMTFTDSVDDVTITSPTTASPQTVTSLPATVTVNFNYVTSVAGVTTGVLDVLGAPTAISANKSLTSGTHSDSISVTIPAGTPNNSYNVKVTVTNTSGSGANNKNDGENNAVIVNVPSNVAPTVVSINRAVANPTNAANVSWTVTFSENVSGVDAGDFALVQTGLTGTSITGVSAGPASVYTVTASTGNGTGTLRLNLNDNDSITDSLGAKLGGTGTGTVGSGGAGNGSFSGEVYSLDRTLTPFISAQNKEYDGTNAATVTFGFTSNLPVTEDVFVTGTATFDNKNIGNGKTVTATGLTLGGTDAAKYVLTATTATDTANITQKHITGTFTAADKVYDGNTSATVLTRDLNGDIEADDVEFTGGTATFDNKNVGTDKTVTLTGATLSGTDAGNYILDSVATALADITVKHITGTFTADNKVYDGNTSATVLARALIGDIAADDVELTGGNATFDNKNVGMNKTVTLSGASLTGTDAGNYALDSVATDAANITPKHITGTFTAPDKVYDGNTSATALTRGLVGDIAADDVELTGGTATFDNKNVGIGKVVTLSGATLSGIDAGNYVLDSIATTLANITPKALTVAGITANNKPFDGNTTATLNLTLAALVGVVPGDAVTLNTAGAVGTFLTSEVGGPHVVTISGLTISGADSGNYTLTQPVAMASITAWYLTGFYQPVGIPNSFHTPPTGTLPISGILNTIKGGQTVPLKFEIFEAVGGTERTSVSAVLSFTLTPVACDGSSSEDPVDFTTTGGTSLRYDGVEGQFIQNWQSPKGPGKCYRATMTAADGSSISAFFKTK